MNLKKFIQAIAIVLCFSFMNSVISVAASGASAIPQGELSVQDVSADSVSEQAKKQGEDYYVSLLFVFIHSKPSMFSSAGIVIYGRKVTVLSDSGFYTYVKTENGTKGYIFTAFLSKSLFKAESDLIPVDYANVYLGDTKNNLVTAVNTNGSVSWTVTPNGIIDFDEKTGDITGLKYGTATITARSGFKSDTCVVHCIYEWKKSWVGKATTSATVKTGPGDSYDSIITMKSGHKFTVYGDGGTSENGADSWAYGKYTINGNDYYGYVKINNISTKGTVSQYNNKGCVYPIRNTKYKNISSVYGWRNSYRHLGFDINRGTYESIKGETAVAIFKGKVTFVNNSYNSTTRKPDYGYCVVVESDFADPVSGNKLRAVYMHFNEKVSLQVEDEIKAGDVVGKIGTTGNSTGPHLHLEINNKGTNFAGSYNSDSFDKTINPIFFFLNSGLSDGNDSSNEYWYNDNN